MRIFRFDCLALALGTLVFSACGDEAPDVQDGFANLRAMHLVQGGPDYDIVLNQSPEPTADDVSFTDSSDYREVAVGSYTLEVRAPGDQVVLTTNITLENQQSYTFVIYDRPEGPQGALFQDGFDIASGEIKIRLFHTAVGRGPMALYFLPEDGAVPQVLTDPVAYGEASAATALADGNHNVGIDVDLNGVVDVTYDLPPLSDGTLANVFAVLDENADLDLILQMNNGFTWDLDGEGGATQARARGIHLISAGPALSIFTGGAAVSTGLNFLQQSEYVGVPGGTADILVGPDAANPLFTIMDAEFSAGQDYTIVLFGSPGQPLGRTIADVAGDVPTDRVRVRMVHTAQDVGEIDFWDFNQGGAPVSLFEDLDLGEASDPTDLAPGSYRLAVDVNNDDVFDAFFDTPPLPAGQLVNLYAVMENGSPRLVTQMQSGVMSIPMIMP